MDDYLTKPINSEQLEKSMIKYFLSEEHCGDISEYKDALTVFTQPIEIGANEIKKYYNGKDWKNYTIKVHVLKSSSRCNRRG